MTTENQATELDTLKARADLMGIKYSDNIGVETLRKRINEKLAGTQSEVPDVTVAPISAPTPAVDPIKAIRDEALKLIRVRVVPLDTTKRDYQGEIYSAGNASVPTVRRFVIFNEITHIENILYQQLVDKEHQYFISRKLSSGQVIRESKVGKAFSIEVLDPLTTEELAELEKSQLMRKATD